MIAHTGILVGDYAKSKEFYTKALAPLGYEFSMESGDACGFKEGGNTSFWISAAKTLVPLHVAFEAKDKASVDAFHKEALKYGATDNGAPGYRVDYWPGYYAAFILDRDGHNIEAVWFDYSKVKKGKK